MRRYVLHGIAGRAPWRFEEQYPYGGGIGALATRLGAARAMVASRTGMNRRYVDDVSRGGAEDWEEGSAKRLARSYQYHAR